MTDKKKAMRAARLRKQRARRLALTLCLIVATMLVSVGGTLAWLTANTAPVVNMFTAGDINITLAETTGTQYKVVPGVDIEKDPVVTVKANSEACWLFVKVVASDNWNSNMTYAIAGGWTPLTGVDGVYYREVSASTADQPFDVLAGNKVEVSNEMTKAECEAINEAKPTLTFTAYAVQSDNVADAATAWGYVPTT